MPRAFFHKFYYVRWNCAWFGKIREKCAVMTKNFLATLSNFIWKMKSSEEKWWKFEESLLIHWYNYPIVICFYLTKKITDQVHPFNTTNNYTIFYLFETIGRSFSTDIDSEKTRLVIKSKLLPSTKHTCIVYAMHV